MPQVSKQVLALMLLLALPVVAEPPALIPRQVLFGDPQRAQPRLSPDGKRLAWLEPEHGVMQIWVQAVGATDAAPVTAERQRPVLSFEWTADARRLLYTQDSTGNGIAHLFVLEPGGKPARDLTPAAGTRTELLQLSAAQPSQVLVTMPGPSGKGREVYRLDLDSGVSTPELTNPGDIDDWKATDDLRVRAVRARRPDGGWEIRVQAGAGSPWRTLTQVSGDDWLELHDVTDGGASVLYTTSAGPKPARLVERPFSGGPEKVLASHPEVDVESVWLHPLQHAAQGVVFEPGAPTWMVLDPTVKKDLDIFPHLTHGFGRVISRDAADRTWLVEFSDPRGPRRWFTFDRESLKGTFLFSDRPSLESAPLVDVIPVRFTARDGVPLHGYFTRAAGTRGRAPLVVLVHPGPWTRVHPELDPEVQWLANRGYSVVQVNFRGSTGYGRKFLEAGNRQWGKAMQLDLLDAVEWAVKGGVADRARVAIVGRSYGGYAALAAAAFTPEAFRCALDFGGPSNLVGWIRANSAPGSPFRAVLVRRLGNVDSPADRAALDAVSPLLHLDRIRLPLLIGQGGEDRWVTPGDAERLLSGLEQRGMAVTSVVYPDEGHQLRRMENVVDFHARAEAFLAACLGGRAEPLEGERVPGSSAVVKVVASRPPTQ
jgi:dipeptidyl aminopeptidase/acylaminoacyl peptidase